MELENHPDLWLSQFPFKRGSRHKHKYDYGHAVIVGAEKMTGATRLAAEACARIGAGLTTVIAPVGTEEIYRRTLAPHVIVEDRANGLDAHLKDERRNSILIGPGNGNDYKKIRDDIHAILASGNRAVVFDADALNALVGQGDMPFHESCVLTPHEGEFSRLFPQLMTGIKTEKAITAAELCGCVMVLKGEETIIAARGRPPVVNSHASPWLATAGTGDVLAGMITGLLAQGMEPFHAACAAVWVHGEAALRFGSGLVAGDLAGHVPGILEGLYDTKNK